MKKSVLAVCCLVLLTAGLFAGGKQGGGSGSASGKIEVSIIMKSRGSPYFTALTNSVKEGSEKLGWTVSVYDSNDDSVKETENLEAAIAKKVKLIFLDNYESLSVVPLINRAYDAGIPVIAIDSGVGPGAKFVTTVYSNNIENGRAVGLTYINQYAGKDKPLIAILLSGTKGNPVGEERRTGLFAGIIQARLGLSPDAALAAAKEFNRELTVNGRAKHEKAKFEVRGQGWGQWSRDGGRTAADDLIVANKDLNLLMGENDEMNLGAMGALEVAGLKGKVDIIAAADGSKAAYDLMKVPGSGYIATGENSPTKVGIKAVEIAKEILIDGKDPWGYPEITMTEAFAVTKENADEHYEYGF
ncbi:MAG: substrate-binding domain-containing protein [Treponema sp.]|jgi:ribose transport system substrate-binding protein|nr:substrate-binding domain-containing protein [Treponema sp.]